MESKRATDRRDGRRFPWKLLALIPALLLAVGAIVYVATSSVDSGPTPLTEGTSPLTEAPPSAIPATSAVTVAPSTRVGGARQVQVTTTVPPEYAPFVGTWRAHGYVVTITGTQGKADFSGGQATFTLFGASDKTAFGYVDQSSDASALPVGSILLTLHPGDVLVLKPYTANPLVLCGPTAAPSCVRS